jgi:hypothetical protein
MRTFALLLLLAGIALPARAVKRITVDQLEQVLAAAPGKPDAEVAQQLFNLELTERLNGGRLARWETQLPGPRSRQALVALADVSAFLNLPATEIPATAAPDFAAQRRMMALTVDYASKTIHQLPNFSATRVTTSFQDRPWKSERAQAEHVRDQPLQPFGAQSAAVVYRNGDEVVQSSASQSGASLQGLTTTGEFGPILLTMLLDAARSKLAWSHWERGPAGPVAVFRSAVPEAKSHYQVAYCCIQKPNGDHIYFRQFSGYQGEIAVDPANGTILRLVLKADLKPSDPIVQANILVEYGPVEIGGKTYICPVRSVALSLQLELDTLSGPGAPAAPGPMQTLLNDVVFERYHLFRAEARMLAGTNDDAARDPSASAPEDPGNLAKPAAAGKAAPAENAPGVAPPAPPPPSPAENPAPRR